MGLDILNFWWFYGYEKLLFTEKLLVKRKLQKIKKTPHTVLEKIILQIISKNFCKVILNSKELQLLK